MPELPEVQTTVDGINEMAKGLTIKDVWTSYNSPSFVRKDEIKNPKYFKIFKEEIVGNKILNAKRRAKNILINLTGNKTILIHMKMTGHLLYGKYTFDKKNNTWKPIDANLKDPFSRFVRLVFVLSDGKCLALSDMRKFAKITLLDTDRLDDSIHLRDLGPEPLLDTFTEEDFIKCLEKKGSGKIKTTLMDPYVIAGIGNIYSDEILWASSIHPESVVEKIPKDKIKKMFKIMKIILKKGIDFGGDSMSDYRNIKGERGAFQNEHNAYKLNKTPCKMKINNKKCTGTISRKVIATRSAHFCDTHQVLFTDKSMSKFA